MDCKLNLFKVLDFMKYVIIRKFKNKWVILKDNKIRWVLLIGIEINWLLKGIIIFSYNILIIKIYDYIMIFIIFGFDDDNEEGWRVCFVFVRGIIFKKINDW